MYPSISGISGVSNASSGDGSGASVPWTLAPQQQLQQLQQLQQQQQQQQQHLLHSHSSSLQYSAPSQTPTMQQPPYIVQQQLHQQQQHQQLQHPYPQHAVCTPQQTAPRAYPAVPIPLPLGQPVQYPLQQHPQQQQQQQQQQACDPGCPQATADVLPPSNSQLPADTLPFTTPADAVRHGYDVMVYIGQARGLPGMDWWNGLADPYVLVTTVTPGAQEIKYRCVYIVLLF
jgi:hypothetical protein